MSRARVASRCALVSVLLLSQATWAETAPRVPRHFQDTNEDLPDQAFTAVAVAPSDGEVIFAGTEGFVFKTDDGGETWRPMLSFPRGLSVEVELALEDPTFALGESGVPMAPDRDVLDPTEIDLSDFSDEHGEIDAGDDYDDEAPDDEDIRSLPRADAVGLPEGDADLRARYPHERAGVRRIHIPARAAGTVWVATSRGLYKSTDLGESFSVVQVGGGPLVADVRDVATDPGDPESIFLATASGLFISRDGGETFRRGPDRTGAAPVIALAVTRSAGDVVIVVAASNGLLKSRDGGESFRELILKGSSAFAGAGVVAFERGEKTIYVGTHRGLFAGERDAAILESRQAFRGRSVQAISPDPRRARGIAVGLAQDGVVQSEDSGISVLYLSDVPATTVFDIARPPGETDALVVATDRGVFRYVEGTGITAAEDRAIQLRRIWRKEPTLAETARAALAYSRVDTRWYSDAVTRARLAPLLPRLRLRGQLVLDARGDRILISAVDPNLQLETDAEELQEQERVRADAAGFASATGLKYRVMLTATWETDLLLFNVQELRAVRELKRQNTFERSVLDTVRALYAARRRAMAEVYLDPPDTPRQLSRSWLRFAELTALLSAATGGRFVELARARGAELAELEAADGSLFNLEPK